MMKPRSCKKCGHLHLQATHAELEACPECGAIYSRVEAAIKEGRLTAYTPQAPKQKTTPAAAPEPAPQAAAAITPTPPPKPNKIAAQPFIEVLRQQTNYPNFRVFVNLCTGFGYIVAVVFGIVGVVSLATGNILGATVGICAAIFIVIISRYFKELFSMMADLSDSAAIIAENSIPKQS